METTEKLQKNWVKVYPIYIDKDMKRSEGRKMPAEFSVEAPTAKEIHSLMKSINLESVMEYVMKFFFIILETSS